MNRITAILWPRRRFLAIASAAGAFASLAPWPALAAAGDEKAALALVREFAKKTLEFLRDKKLPRAAREKRVRELYHKYFAVRSIGRFALGRFWRRATPTERTEYLDLFEVYAVKMLSAQTTKYADQKFKVTHAMPDGKGVAVAAQVFTAAGKPIDVKFRVRRGGSRLYIVDVLVENLSMSLTVRNEFASIIQKNEGGIKALMDSLRKKIHQLDNKKTTS